MALNIYSSLKGWRAQALDKSLGNVKDVYFDDRSWKVRYLLVNSAKWLSTRSFLISTEDLKPIKDGAPIPIALNWKKIKQCQSTNKGQPISREFEHSINKYFGLSPYWEQEIGVHPQYPYGAYLYRHRQGPIPLAVEEILEARTRGQSSTLRSCGELQGYRVNANDGKIGFLEDFLIDFETWEIPYLIVDTRKWWQGKRVTIPQHIVSGVDWLNERIHVFVSKEAVETSPEWFADETAESVEKKVLNHYFDYFDRPSLAKG